ncbi:polyprenyl diphosphate synthase [Altererythrobacter sp.]|uniref:polyprenyl diphosphate synthase n=1 Tax=Altererythrobacter sp. TaxID=1872480 RepID=UPI001B1B7DCE|nr:polyprenyl diphosphate synthase [Altererythrobacter sp.]MBO6609719.1 di-trans,poly-cis-decaprenylcistransferase [Altererythrobacter sp.]MBO6641131.1 di-trans,poly-cis-decaprenylcistransferase [Altererythrobacter sp.]MBO6708171.1 di-trans,poly-cis-decaprenylcistransferase [Altererythrobacter sp.]MBO6945694.1 di-trans,poly-cis-decaprenylcistransferase [Altererythrobacter sp.]
MGETPSKDTGRARHVAIIMDGNGRWAKKRAMPRSFGHKRGVEALRNIVRSLDGSGLDCLTLYAFSSENWKRSEDEVGDLMNLMRKFIKSDLQEFIDNGVRLKIIGDWQSLAPDIVEMLEDALEKTSSGTHTVAVALNYGSQQEIARAAAKAAAIGEVNERSIAAHLDTADLPPLDLLIRTSGEIRLSNFLLWQSAYAEMLFVDTLWPDFTPEMLQQALDDFAQRERRFGGR